MFIYQFNFITKKSLFRGFSINTEIAQSSDITIRIPIALSLNDRLGKRGVPTEDQDGDSGELSILPDDLKDKFCGLVAAVELPVPVGDDPDLV